MPSELTRVEIDGRDLPVTMDLAGSEVQLEIDGQVARLAFRVQGAQLAAVHTEVPAAFRGKGVGNTLATALLDHVRREGMTIQPYCPFVAAFIARHEAYADLVDPAFRQAAEERSLKSE